MSGSLEQRFLQIINGRARGPGPVLARGLLAAAEPLYAAVTHLRNQLFDARLKSARRLDRPVISVGNITTGGTGKTPMVRWLAERLRREGRHVAILSRGYRAAPGTLGDELSMLDRALNESDAAPIPLVANSDRFAAGVSLVHEHPELDVFLLDDGFQHRRLHRDLDIVLINAAEPFGFGHVLPRGLLREPLAGLRRAGAIVITHADAVTAGELAAIESKIRRYNERVPLYRAVHAQTGLRTSEPGRTEHPMSELSRRRFFAFCGIGNPGQFDRALRQFADTYAGHHWFGDHHAYTPADLASLSRQARDAGAEVLLTTEKDWVKVASFAPVELPVWRGEVRIQFLDADEQRLLDQIQLTCAVSTRAASG